MSFNSFLLASFAGAAVGSAAVALGGLDVNPGVAIGASVASAAYIASLLFTCCSRLAPIEKDTQDGSDEQNEEESEPKEKKKKKKKKKSASRGVKAEPLSPVEEEEKEDVSEVDEPEGKKLSKTQARRLRLKLKKEAAEKAAAASELKSQLDAKLIKMQEKVAKEAAQKAAEVRAAGQKLLKQTQKAVEEGWETQKTKDRKAAPVKPLDTPKEVIKAEVAAAADKVKAFVNVPKNMLGAVIGAGGANIKAITQKTLVHITTPKEETPGPVLIEGDEKGVAAAKSAIESILKFGVSSITHPGSTMGKVNLTDESQIGIIIGPKGVNIQKLQKDLKVTIKMPAKDDRKLTVTISGPKEQVKLAKEAIEDLIHLGYSKITHPDASVIEVAFPSASVGRLIGPRGQNIKGIQGNTKCKITIPKPGNPRYKPDTILIVGPAAKLESAKKQVLNTLIEKEYYTEDYGDPNDPNYEEPEEDY